MRSYIITSGILFGLLVLVHGFRLFAEGLGPLQNPVFLVSTLTSVAMSVWAWFAFKATKPTSPGT